jgi:uncharacterized membrane protein YpjA
MHLLTNWRVIVFGLASWLAPFVVSLAFYGGDGELLAPRALFKSVMVVVSGGVGALLLVYLFGTIRASIGAGVIIGSHWLAINVVLDLLIVAPMANLNLVDYVYDIGFRYLLIPIMAAAMGAVAKRAAPA